MALTYIQIIGYGFPNVKCHAPGNSNNYNSLIWDSGDPIPAQSVLDAWAAANPNVGQVAGDGLTVKSGDTETSRSIQGTANQVAVSNGDGISGNPTVSLAANPVIPGNSGMTLPAGTVSQRPVSPADGTIRANIDSGLPEIYINGSWIVLNTVSDNIALSARRSTTLTFTNAATRLTLDTVDLVSDSSKLYRDNTNTDRLYTTEAGLFMLIVSLRTTDTVAAQTHTLTVRQNTAVIPQVGSVTLRPNTSTTATATVAIPVILNAGDYVSAEILRSGTTGTSTVQAGATVSLIRLNGLPGPQGPIGGDNVYRYFASEFDNPTNANWAVNALAPAIAEATNGFVVRAFDDTTEEGIGFMLNIPAGVSNMTISLKLRPASAQASPLGAVFKLYNRSIPDGAAVSSWANGLLNTVTLQAANFVYVNQTFTLSALNVVAGRLTQFELTRVGGNASDTIVGDVYLIEAAIAFS